ncbi:MAG TPA: heme-binding domain-containing protein [Pyrinomonadaceae bacterium]|nr:heme-binding domain-containing protein [Pyrinomonadaceae bacterium]
MKRLKRSLQIAFMVLLAAIVVVQFVGPARSNPMAPPAHDFTASIQITPEVREILTRSCGDCHSNKTRWPWYSSVAPVSWFVIDHVNHGRQHLNFSEWGRYNSEESEEILEHICKEVKSGNMPLSSYTLIHRKAKLSGDDVKVLCDWANSQRKSLKARSESEGRDH